MTENRLMVFIDGTNLLNRLREHVGLSPSQLDPFAPPSSVFHLLNQVLNNVNGPMSNHGDQRLRHMGLIRAHWFGAYRAPEDQERIEKALWEAHFRASTLLELRGRREKGVDMHLAVDMLVHAQMGNFTTALLVAGDEDYVRLVHEAKRYGCMIFGAFFSTTGMSPMLLRALDGFEPLEKTIDGPVRADVDRFKASLPAPGGISRRDRAERFKELGNLGDEFAASTNASERTTALNAAGLILTDVFGQPLKVTPGGPQA